MRERLRGARVPLLYLITSVLLFLPVWLSLDSKVVGQDDIDSSGFIWCLAWWPQALLDGANPFITDSLYVPDGYNLTWAASLAAPALLLAPVTLLAGATVSFNLLLLLSPPLNAWGAYALCRHVTGSFWPSVMGGYLFGFSPYVIGTLKGSAPNLSLVALLPVMVLLVLRRMDGSLSDRRFVLLMTPALVFQLLTGSEVLAMATLFGGFALLIAALTWPERRSALLRTVGLLAVAYALAGLVLSPFLLAMLEPHASPEHADPRAFVTDLYGLFVPGQLQLGGARRAEWWSALGLSVGGDNGSFIGLALIAVAVLFAVRGWRDRAARMVTLCAAMFVVAALGPELVAGGRPRGVPLPWEPFVHLPLLRYALPVRFTLFVFLALSVVVAMWLARRPSRGRWALALAGLLLLAPNFLSPELSTPAEDPPLFRSEAWRAQIRPSDRVMTAPSFGRPTRWAARTQIGFRLAGGYVGARPRSYTRFRAFNELSPLVNGNPGERELRRLIDAKGVTVVLTQLPEPPRVRKLLSTLGVSPRRVGGVAIYRLRGGSSASATGTGP